MSLTKGFKEDYNLFVIRLIFMELKLFLINIANLGELRYLILRKGRVSWLAKKLLKLTMQILKKY